MEKREGVNNAWDVIDQILDCEYRNVRYGVPTLYGISKTLK